MTDTKFVRVHSLTFLLTCCSFDPVVLGITLDAETWSKHSIFFTFCMKKEKGNRGGRETANRTEILQITTSWAFLIIETLENKLLIFGRQCLQIDSSSTVTACWVSRRIVGGLYVHPVKYQLHIALRATIRINIVKQGRDVDILQSHRNVISPHTQWILRWNVCYQQAKAYEGNIY